MAARSAWFGSGISTWRSKRPGRRSAGSSTSGRFVAAMTTMPVPESNPSISARSWFKVCSRSSLEMIEPPRFWPMASISSMKMIEGALLWASANRSRTRDAPTPTNISTKLEPVRAKKGTSASPATARAMRVLPLPGGPDHEDASGTDGAGALVAGRVLQEVDDLAHLPLGALVAGDVGKARGGSLLVVDLGLGAPDTHDAAGELPAGAPGDPHEDPDEEQQRQEGQQVGHEARGGSDARHRDVVGFQDGGELGVVEDNRDLGGVVVAVVELALHAAVRVDRGGGHLVRLDPGEKRAEVETDRRGPLHARKREQEDRGQEPDEKEPPARLRRWRGCRLRLRVSGRSRLGRAGEMTMLHCQDLPSARWFWRAYVMSEAFAHGRLCPCRSI